MKDQSDKQSSIHKLNQPMLLWSLPYTYLYFALPIISKIFGASALEIGGLFTIFTVTTLLLRPVVGWMLDRMGRKIFFIMALVIYAISLAIFAFAESLSWLYAARCVQGIGSAFFWAAVHTIIADLTPTDGRGQALGEIGQVTASGGMIGIFAALGATALFPQDLGWKVIFIVFSLCTLYAAILAWKQVPVTQSEPPAANQKPVLSRPLLHLLLIVFITAIPEAMLSPIYLIYLQDKFSADIGTIAWAFFPAGLVTMFLGSRLGAISDRLGRTPMMAIGLLGSGIFSLLMPGLPSVLWLAVLYTLNSLLWGLSEPAETALVSELTGGNQIGMGYGLYDFIENLGFAVGPLLGGFLYDTVGTGIPFYLNGIILIFAAGWVWIFLRGKKTISGF